MKKTLVKLMAYLSERLREPSSIRGFVWVATGGALHLNASDPVSMDNAAAAGMVLAGLLGIFLPDSSKKKDGE